MSRNSTATPQPPTERPEDMSTPTKEQTPPPTVEKSLFREASPSQVSSDIDQNLRQAEARANKDHENVNGTQSFDLYQQLMRTEITIEYGHDLKERGQRIVHLELLCCYSQQVKKLFANAEAQRQVYAEAVLLRKKVKALLPPKTPASSFSDDHANKAMHLIGLCLKRYPLKQHQVPLRSNLAKYADENLFKNTKMLKGPPSNGSIKKASFRDMDLFARVQYLNVEGVYNLTQELFHYLWIFKGIESNNACQSSLKAAAQRRIILPRTDGETVNSVSNWLYFNKLHFRDAGRLYQIHRLAETLGIRNLAETCLNKLANAAFATVHHASSQGLSLLAILYGNDRPLREKIPTVVPDNLVDIASIVFLNVLKEENTPAILQELVINAIADSKDCRLFTELRHMVSHEMALRIIEAFMIRPTSAKAVPKFPKIEIQEEEKLETKADSPTLPDDLTG